MTITTTTSTTTDTTITITDLGGCKAVIPGDSDGKVSACNGGDLGWIPGLGRSPGEGNGYPLQYSCLKNPTEGPSGLLSMGLQRVKHS